MYGSLVHDWSAEIVNVTLSCYWTLKAHFLQADFYTLILVLVCRTAFPNSCPNIDTMPWYLFMGCNSTCDPVVNFLSEGCLGSSFWITSLIHHKIPPNSLCVFIFSLVFCLFQMLFYHNLDEKWCTVMYNLCTCKMYILQE